MQPEIDCGSFKLRPPQPSDKESMAKYANNINVWKNVRDVFPHPYSVQDAAAFINRCNQEHPVISFAIEFKKECIGMIGFIPQIDVYRKSAEIGYWLGEPFWGKGIATLAVQKLVAYIFENFDLARLYAGIFEWNPASMKVLQKAGFKLECVFEKSIYKAGTLINEHRFCLLKS